MGGLSIIHWLILLVIVGAFAAAAMLLARRNSRQAAATTDTTKLARVAVMLLLLWFASDVALAASSLYTIQVLGGLGGGIAPARDLASADTVSAAVGLLYTIANVGAGIAILRWIYVTNRTAHALSDAMTVTPGWAVARFFIPIANLWKPFEGVRQTWQATLEPTAPDAIAVPALLRWWWGLWITTSILGNIQFRLSMADKPAELIAANWWAVAAIPVDLPLTIVLATMMSRLSRLQHEAVTTAADDHPAR